MWNTLVSFSFARMLALRGLCHVEPPFSGAFLKGEGLCHVEPPFSGAFLKGEGLCHVEFRGAPEDAQNWFVASADLTNLSYETRILGWLQAFFLHFWQCSHPTLDTRAKTISQRRLFPVSLIYPVLATLSVCFSWVMFSCQDVTDHCTLAGSADSPFFVCRDHSTPPLLGSKHGMESLGFSSSYAENFWVLTRGANNTN